MDICEIMDMYIKNSFYELTKSEWAMVEKTINDEISYFKNSAPPNIDISIFSYIKVLENILNKRNKYEINS